MPGAISSISSCGLGATTHVLTTPHVYSACHTLLQAPVSGPQQHFPHPEQVLSPHNLWNMILKTNKQTNFSEPQFLPCRLVSQCGCVRRTLWKPEKLCSFIRTQGGGPVPPWNFAFYLVPLSPCLPNLHGIPQLLHLWESRNEEEGTTSRYF